MTRQSISRTAQHPVEVSVHRPLDLGQGVAVMGGDALEELGKLVIDRRAEPLPRISLLPLRIADLDGLALQVDPIHGDAGLGEAAAEVKLKLEGGGHPSGLVAQGLPHGGDLGCGDLALLLRGGHRDSCQGEAVRLGQPSPDRLTHEEAEELQLGTGRVVAGMLPSGPLPPVEVGLGMLVGDLARHADPLLVQEDMDGAPEVSGSQESALVLVMVAQVGGNPLDEIPSPVRSDDGLLRGPARRLLHGLGRILRAIDAQLQILIAPPLGVDIPVAHIPERRPLFADQERHA